MFKQLFSFFITGVVLLLGMGCQNNSQPVIVSQPSYSGGSLESLLQIIKEVYVDTLDYDQIEEGAIEYIMKQLDPHSTYISPEQLASVSEDVHGKFGGIGIQFQIIRDTITVIAVVAGGPSERVGVQAGDKIIEVNDSVFVGEQVTSYKAVSTLRGEIGTEVDILVKRLGSPEAIPFSIVRGEIPSYSVDAKTILTDDIGFIRVNRFSVKTASEFRRAMRELVNKGMEKVIIDLRGNPGGVLDDAVDMCNLFLEKGDTILFTANKARQKGYFIAQYTGEYSDMPVTVLIDEFSASASEIIAGCLQDNDEAIVVGRRSFGKGLVQSSYELSNGGVIRLTVARYYTPSGRSIQKPFVVGEKGQKEYSKDIYERYAKGEFVNQDSIQFNESLRFTTRGGRVVYGGGGIMPDEFIPLDTLEYDLTGKVIQKRLLRPFSIDYVNGTREKLSQWSNGVEMWNFLDKTNLMNDFYKYIQKELRISESQYNEAKEEIKRQLFGLIIRDMLDFNGYYQAIYQDDLAIAKAVEVLRLDK